MFSLIANEWFFVFERLCEKQNVPDVLAAELLFVSLFASFRPFVQFSLVFRVSFSLSTMRMAGRIHHLLVLFTACLR